MLCDRYTVRSGRIGKDTVLIHKAFGRHKIIYTGRRYAEPLKIPAPSRYARTESVYDIGSFKSFRNINLRIRKGYRQIISVRSFPDLIDMSLL